MPLPFLSQTEYYTDPRQLRLGRKPRRPVKPERPYAVRSSHVDFSDYLPPAQRRSSWRDVTLPEFEATLGPNHPWRSDQETLRSKNTERSRRKVSSLRLRKWFKSKTRWNTIRKTRMRSEKLSAEGNATRKPSLFKEIALNMKHFFHIRVRRALRKRRRSRVTSWVPLQRRSV